MRKWQQILFSLVYFAFYLDCNLCWNHIYSEHWKPNFVNNTHPKSGEATTSAPTQILITEESHRNDQLFFKLYLINWILRTTISNKLLLFSDLELVCQVYNIGLKNILASLHSRRYTKLRVCDFHHFNISTVDRSKNQCHITFWVKVV